MSASETETPTQPGEGAEDQRSRQTTHWSQRLLSNAETFVYGLIAIFLFIGALSLVGASAFHFTTSFGEHGAEHAVLRALEDLLLVIMLVEITHTVGISLREKRLICEPFLIVGVIAAVRRMLIITAEMATPNPENAEIFRLFMIELGILTGTIVALTLGIFLLRRAGR